MLDRGTLVAADPPGALLAETGTDSLADVLETLVGAEMPTVYAGRQRGEEE